MSKQWFELKEHDRIRAEKECMTALKKVINICLEKDYIFNIHTDDGISSISVTMDRWETSFTSYFKGGLIGFTDGNTITIFELLKILKQKQP